MCDRLTAVQNFPTQHQLNILGMKRSPFDFEHIIWDWNGTLIDDTWMCHEIMIPLIDEYGGTQVTLDGYRDLFCHPLELFFEALNLRIAGTEFFSFNEKFHTAYEARRHECLLHPEGKDLLTLLNNKAIPQSVLSSHPDWMLRDGLQHFGITQEFEHIAGLGDHSCGSKVDNGHALLKKVQVSPANAAIIGDSFHDFEVAHALGIESFIIAVGAQSSSNLTKRGVPHFADYSEFLAGR